MFSRVTLLEVDTVRTDVDEALERYRQEVLPRLREQPGYEGAFVLLNPEGQGLVMSLWSSEEALESTMPIASVALQRFATIFRAPPGRERYEVRLADLPSHAID
jgi:Antibiotic biosynthesis monooxygenase